MDLPLKCEIETKIDLNKSIKKKHINAEREHPGERETEERGESLLFERFICRSIHDITASLTLFLNLFAVACVSTLSFFFFLNLVG